MRKGVFVFLVIMNVFLGGCNSRSENCGIKNFHFQNRSYQTEGCLVNDLEDGDWSFYDDSKKLIEKGFFDKGIRTGKWHYPINKNDTVIEWKKYLKENLNLLFNIPIKLEVIEDSTEYIKFSNGDSSKLFNLVLSVHGLVQAQKSIDNYYLQAEEEIIRNEWKFNSKNDKIIAKDATFYLNEYTIHITESNGFKVLNIYRLIQKDKLLEVSCRYDESTETTAKTIFYSVITNIFYDNKRFFNPFEELKTIKSISK